MKSKILFCSLSVLFFSVFVNHYSNGQNVRRSLEISERYYNDGEYDKALYNCEKLQKKIGRKKVNGVSEILLRKAKYHEALGQYQEFENEVASALNFKEGVFSRSKSGNGKLLYARGLLEVSYLYVLHGDLITAEDYLHEAKGILSGGHSSGSTSSSEVLDNYFRWMELFLEVKFHIARGEFDLFDSKIAELTTLSENRITTIEPHFDPIENIFDDSWSVHKFEIKERRRKYAEVKTLHGDAKRIQGDYTAADDLLQETDAWIKSNLSKKDVAYINNVQAQTMLYIDRGDDIHDIRKVLEKNIFLAERRLGLVHKDFMVIHETLIDFYIKYKYSRKSDIQHWEIDKNTAKYFGNDKTQHAMAERLDAKKDFYRQDYKSAIKILNELYSNKTKIPTIHIERVKLLEQMYETSLALFEEDSAISYLEQNLKIIEKLMGKNSLKYHMTQMEKANFYLNNTNQFSVSDTIIRNTFYGEIQNKLLSSSSKYLELVSQCSEYFETIGNYDTASMLIASKMDVLEKNYGKDDIHYAIGLERQIDLNLALGKYKEANSQIDTMLNLFKTKYQKRAQSFDYSEALETAARYYATIGLYNDARLSLSKAGRLFKRSSVATTNSNAVDELSELYLNTGRFERAEELLEKSIKKREDRFGEGNRFLITPFNLQAQIALESGDYVAAQKLADKAEKIAENIFGVNSLQIVKSYTIKAKISEAIGDYVKAEEYIKQSIAIEKKLLGEEHIALALSYTNLGLVKFYEGESLDKTEEYLQKSVDIISDNLGIENPVYAVALKNLALIYIEQGKLKEALDFLDKSNSIWISKLGGENNIHSAEIYMLTGDLEIKRDNLTGAENHFTRARKIYGKIFNKSHPNYAKATSRLGRVSFIEKNYKKAVKYSEEALSNYTNYIEKFFPALSDREKARYWSKIRTDYEFYNNLAIAFGEKRKKMKGRIYDNVLATKSILLSSSIKVRNAILNSGDSTLIGNYNDWVDKKELLTKVLAMSSDQQRDEGLDPKKIEKEIETIEKELSEQSNYFDNKTSDKLTSWKDIKNTLGYNEVAIEIIRYRHFDKNFTDSVLYAALIIDQNTKKAPKIVVLPKGNDMEGKFLKYYRTCIEYTIEDENSYQFYWEPISKEIPEDSKIYLSSEGVYNQLNLEAMPDENGVFVIEKANIALVSNTKDLLKRNSGTGAQNVKGNIELFGNPVFYKDLAKDEFNVYTDKSITQLPGTKIEVEKIEALLKNTAGVEATAHYNAEATEDKVKNMHSPKVFHIATHGFFMPDQSVAGESELNENKTVNNPLLRSGVLLRYAGDLMEDNNVYNFNKENGILTAYEAMNLNLDSTQLVVLSACETGRGDVKVGEGVYGLQRAFLVAGADAIIMSLFKVNDQATQKLMVYFYENWIENGMDKREAFVEAKKRLREDFEDPIYWAAFIMVGSV